MSNFGYDTLQVHGIDEHIDTEKVYKNATRIPLGTKKPHKHYDWLNMTAEEIDDAYEWWPINKSEPFNIIIISRARTHKTVIMKRLLTYFYGSGYRCVWFDAKSDYNDTTYMCDSMLSAYKGLGRRYHPSEVPTSIPVIGCIPSFVATQNSYSPLDPNIVDKFKIKFTLDIRSITDWKEWETLFGVSPAAVRGLSAIKDELKKGMSISTITKIVDKKRMKEGFFAGSKASIVGVLNALDSKQFFNAKKISYTINGEKKEYPYTFLKLSSLWNKDLVPDICLFQSETAFQKIIITKIIQQEREYHKKYRNFPKLNLFDDAISYITNEEDLIAQEVINTVVLGGSKRFNNIIAVHNPKLFSPRLMEECKDKFISNIGNAEHVKPYLNREQYNVVKNLRVDNEGFNYEYAWCKDDGSVATFFPGGTPCLHTW